MRKIPTLFQRDPDNMRRVSRDVTPGCEWVIEGDGVATRKYDGTCVKIERDGLAVKVFARREVKPGKEPPPYFRAVDYDETTGKTVGWEPIAQSGFARFVLEALDAEPSSALVHLGVRIDERPQPIVLPGTYELCGPKIQGNPEGFEAHVLVPHGMVKLENAPRDYDGLRDYLLMHTFEGIVWHSEDGRMAKLKRRDFV